MTEEWHVFINKIIELGILYVYNNGIENVRGNKVLIFIFILLRAKYCVLSF